MEIFVNDDAAYHAWLYSHLSGYVVNALKGTNPGEPILHRSTCDWITPTPTRSGRPANTSRSAQTIDTNSRRGHGPWTGAVRHASSATRSGLDVGDPGSSITSRSRSARGKSLCANSCPRRSGWSRKPLCELAKGREGQDAARREAKKLEKPGTH